MEKCMIVVKKTEGKKLSARPGLGWGLGNILKWIIMVLCKRVWVGVSWLTKL
jgi:hypothetical protein